MIVEELGREFGAAPDAELGENRLGVVADRISRDPKRRGDLVDREPA